MNRKRKKWWIPILTILVFTVITGCVRTGLSKEAIAKRGLKAKYNEEFIVHEINGSGLDWEATVSPVKSPQIVFKAKFLSDGSVESDGYFHAYAGYMFKQILEEDIKSFFPDSYIRIERVSLRWEGDSSMDFRDMSIDNILKNSVVLDGAYSGCFMDVYVNKDIGSTKNFSDEYEFFTSTVDQYIEEGKMIPLTVSFYWIDEDALNRIEKYFSKDVDDDLCYEVALGVDNFEMGIYTFEGENVGSPPNISVCFDKDAEGFIGSYSEYKRRREIIENGN